MKGDRSMSEYEIKRAINEALDERAAKQLPHQVNTHRSIYKTSFSKPKMEFSKKLIIGALFFIGLFCIASTVAWFLLGEWPQEIAEFFIWPILGIIGYMIKSAVENYAKIKGGDKP